MVVLHMYCETVDIGQCLLKMVQFILFCAGFFHQSQIVCWFGWFSLLHFMKYWFHHGCKLKLCVRMLASKIYYSYLHVKPGIVSPEVAILYSPQFESLWCTRIAVTNHKDLERWQTCCKEYNIPSYLFAGVVSLALFLCTYVIIIIVAANNSLLIVLTKF